MMIFSGAILSYDEFGYSSYILLWGFITANCLFVVIARPFTEWFKNAGYALVLFTSDIQILIDFLMADEEAGYDIYASDLSYFTTAMIFVFTGGVLCIVVYELGIRRLCRRLRSVHSHATLQDSTSAPTSPSGDAKVHPKLHSNPTTIDMTQLQELSKAGPLVRVRG